MQKLAMSLCTRTTQYVFTAIILTIDDTRDYRLNSKSVLPLLACISG